MSEMFAAATQVTDVPVESLEEDPFHTKPGGEGASVLRMVVCRFPPRHDDLELRRKTRAW